MLPPSSPKAAHAAPSHPDRYQTLVWAIVVTIALVLSLRDYDAFQLGVYRDDAAYIILARSLISSDTYGLVNGPGEPRRAQFPVGYPLLLAPWLDVLAGEPTQLKLLSLSATLASATLLFWAWQSLCPGTSYWWGVAVSGTTVLSPLTIDHTRMVMSEPVFMACCLSAMILAERSTKRPLGLPGLAALGMILTVVPLIRTIGLVVAVTIVLYLIIARHSRELYLDIGTMVLAALALVSGILAITPIKLDDLIPSEYVSNIVDRSALQVDHNAALVEPEASDGEVGASVTTNALGYGVYVIPELLLPIRGAKVKSLLADLHVPWASEVIGLVVSGVLLSGYAWWLLRAGASIFTLVPVTYLGCLLLWPYGAERLLYPVLPQLNLFLVAGCVILGGQVIQHVCRGVCAASTGLLIGTVVAGLMMLSGAHRSWRLDDSRLHAGDLERRSAWLREHAPAEAVILTEEPEVDHLYSARRTVSYELVLERDALREELESGRIRYVLVAPALRWQAQYQPVYSARARETLGALEEFVAEGRMRLAYAVDEDTVRVYEWQGTR